MDQLREYPEKMAQDGPRGHEMADRVWEDRCGSRNTRRDGPPPPRGLRAEWFTVTRLRTAVAARGARGWNELREMHATLTHVQENTEQ